MQKLKPSLWLPNARWQFEVFDDFFWYLSPHLWTSLAADGGSSVAIDDDGTGGVLTLTTGATNNNECAVVTTNELFDIIADQPISAEGRIQYTEANTDDANVAFGFMDAFGADALLDDGAGPAASFDGAIIYKVDGETVWRCQSSNGTSKTTTVTTATAGGSSYQRLGIDIQDLDGTSAEITFFLDGQPLLDSTFRRPIKHTLAIASTTQMDFGFYVKAGSANSETPNVDYLWACQRRVST